MKRRNLVLGMILIMLSAMSTGLFAQSYSLGFDGTNDYVNCGNGESLNITADITIELWFYADSWTDPIGTVPGLISKRDTFSDMDWELFYGTGGFGNEIRFWYGNSGTNTLFTGSNVNPSEDTWHHLAVTRSGSDWILYLDGVAEDTDSNSNPIPTGDSLRIGKLGGDVGDSECFQGKIDEVRIWNVSRTQQQIRDNMYSTLTGTESNLIAYYQMNDGSGAELSDNSSNTNTGTLNNMDDSDWITDYLIPEGNGTVDDPYLIATLANLNWLSEDNTLWEYCYEQAADIDASTTINWNSGEGFSPIGSGPSFKGIYDGKEYTIDGLYISRSTNWQGFFGATYNAMISNVGLTNVNITGASEVGGLVGSNNYKSRIHNCYCTGSVTGYNKVGGLIGYNNYQSYIKYSYSEGSVTGDMSEVGGLIGSLYHGPMGIYYCYSSSSVTGAYDTGGLIGFANCSNDTNIMNCYSRGNVICLNNNGNAAFLGSSGIYQTNIYYGYSTGSVTFLDAPNPTDRGFVGVVMGSLAGSYNFWDMETSLQTTAIGAIGKTTVEMKTESTFTDAGWDFDSTWDINAAINDGYPYLIIEPSSSPFAFAIEDTTDEDVPISITLIGYDPDGDDLTFSIYEYPDNGILSGTEPNILYTPDTDWFGTDSFEYEVNDGTNNDYAEVSITVEAVNDAPVADNIETATNENIAVEFTLTGSDVDGDSLTFSVINTPANGFISGDAPDLTYTPDEDWFGIDSLSYIANDGELDSDAAVVTITVNEQSEPPSAPVNVMISVVDSTVTVVWDAVTGATFYRIYSNIDPEAADWGTPIYEGIETTYEYQETSPKMFYRVTANNSRNIITSIKRKI